MSEWQSWRPRCSAWRRRVRMGTGPCPSRWVSTFLTVTACEGRELRWGQVPALPGECLPSWLWQHVKEESYDGDRSLAFQVSVYLPDCDSMWRKSVTMGTGEVSALLSQCNNPQRRSVRLVISSCPSSWVPSSLVTGTHHCKTQITANVLTRVTHYGRSMAIGRHPPAFLDVLALNEVNWWSGLLTLGLNTSHVTEQEKSIWQEGCSSPEPSWEICLDSYFIFPGFCVCSLLACMMERIKSTEFVKDMAATYLSRLFACSIAFRLTDLQKLKK